VESYSSQKSQVLDAHYSDKTLQATVEGEKGSFWADLEELPMK
jgi:hypothetical protein